MTTLRLDVLTETQQALLERVRVTAKETRCTPWLVGGAVRDLLLELPVGDIDITIEGDALRFATALARNLGARLARHERFMTFRLDVGPAPPVDVVTARHEWYPHPGALPEVAPGTIVEDLMRRDFAANAIALDLSNGTLFDPAEGIGDVASRRLRVLHDESFTDDPTRYFRGVRLAQRLGFSFDDATDVAARRAIAHGALQTVTPERLWRELTLVEAEPRAALILEALARADALNRLLGSTRPFSPPQLEGLFECSRRYALAPRVSWIALLAEQPNHAASHAALSKHDLQALSWIHLEGERQSRRLRELRSTLRRLAMLERVPPGAIPWLVAHAPDLLPPLDLARKVRETHVSFDIGATAIAPAQRHRIGRALRHARYAVVLGSIDPSRASDFAQQHLIRYLRASHDSA